MKIANINNHHLLKRCIPWQYENSPRIVSWVFGLEAFGYKMCGQVYDDICNGLIALLDGGTELSRIVLNSLFGSAYTSFVDDGIEVQGAIARGLFKSICMGIGNIMELLGLGKIAGYTFSVVQTEDGWMPHFACVDNPKFYEKIPFALGARLDEAVTPNTAFLFYGNDQYKPDSYPRLISDDERTFVILGGRTNVEIINGGGLV